MQAGQDIYKCETIAILVFLIFGEVLKSGRISMPPAFVGEEQLKVSLAGIREPHTE
jgi:hypothetical protein